VSWLTRRVGADFVLAPDGSQIRPLVEISGRGSLVHCTLPPGQVTAPVQHRTVAEVWYCVGGSGQLWRRSQSADEVVQLEPGMAVSIPLGTGFQFRADADRPLEVVIATMPPWPGNDEAYAIDDAPWEPTV
jgi:mannose-6-phosphate isomerase-like protein (cupin superfamily)